MLKQIAFCLFAVLGNLSAVANAYIYQHEGLFEEIFRPKLGHYNLIRAIVSPNDVILEAGGFDGTDTVRLAHLVPEGKVISFEPNPPTI